MSYRCTTTCLPSFFAKLRGKEAELFFSPRTTPIGCSSLLILAHHPPVVRLVRLHVGAPGSAEKRTLLLLLQCTVIAAVEKRETLL